MMKGKNRRGKSYMKKWQWAHIMKDNWSTQTTHLEWSQKHGGIRQEWRVSAAEPRHIIVSSDLLLLLLSQDAHHADAQLPESLQFSIINCLNLQFNEVSKSKPYIGISSLCDNKKHWTTRVYRSGSEVRQVSHTPCCVYILMGFLYVMFLSSNNVTNSFSQF
jgi:hypothetical protein